MKRNSRGADLLKRAIANSDLNDLFEYEPNVGTTPQHLVQETLARLDKSMPENNINYDYLDEVTGELVIVESISPSMDARSIPSPSLVQGNGILLDDVSGEITFSSSCLNMPNTAEPSPPLDYFEGDDDDRDIDYVPDINDFTDEDDKTDTQNTSILSSKRRGIRRIKQWDRNQQKQLRMEGKAYKGLKKIEGKWTQKNDRPARMFKEACKCASSKLECRKLSETDRKNIYESFWAKLDWGQRKVYVASLVNTIQPAFRRNPNEPSRRNLTLHYHLKVKEQKMRVCKTMFLNTLALGERSVRSWTTQSQSGIPNILPRIPNQIQTLLERKHHLETLLDRLPKMESHYNRKNSSKIYLEPNWDSLTDFYTFYKVEATGVQLKPLSWSLFHQELKRQNITLFQNRKDQCDTCFSYKESRIEKTTYDLHILRKDMGRKQKELDKLLAEMDGTLEVFCVDVQAVLLAPKLSVSLAYYKIKLKIHNFCSFDLATHEGRCFLWDEINGGLEAEVFANLYVNLIQSEYEKSQRALAKIIFWSDGCGYQNRNQTLSNAILNCAIELNIVIEQKYLEHGHTFMEVDSEHSVIERKLKNKDIYLPAEYINLIKSARSNPKPYEVKNLTYNDFLDYSKIQYYNSIRPGNKSGDHVVNDIRCLKYNPNGTIEYKIIYEDDWTLLPRRTRMQITSNTDLPKLYDSKRKITLRKFQDLQDLKSLMHENYHSYYNSLPHECENQPCTHIKK